MKAKSSLIAGAILALFAVIFGAMGAHALKKILTPEELQSFETAVRYQFLHALALMLLGTLAYMNAELKVSLRKPALFILLGTLLFSGSIYLLVLSHQLSINLSFLGPVTPIGGTLMIVGWAWSIKAFLQLKA